jgi:hypothetical protein
MRKLGEGLHRRNQQAGSPSSKKRQGSEQAQNLVVGLRRPLSRPQSARLPLTNAQDIGELSVPDLSIHAQVSNKMTRAITKALEREKETERKNTIIGQERVLSRFKGETECAKLRHRALQHCDSVRHSSLLSKREQTMKEAASLTALVDFCAVEGTRHQNTKNLANILQLEMSLASTQKDALLREALPFSTPGSANKNIQVKVGRRPSEPTIVNLMVNKDHLTVVKADGVVMCEATRPSLCSAQSEAVLVVN